MATGYSTISDLIHPPKKDEQDPSSKLAVKQTEIQKRELEEATEKAAATIGFPYVKLSGGFPISPEALSLIEEKRANDLKTICFYYDGENLRLGSLNPHREGVQDLLTELNEKYYTNGKIYLISEESFEHAFYLYRSLPKISHLEGGVEIKTEDLEKFKKDIQDYKSLQKKINEVNTTDIVTLILATSIKIGSSDIHIEAEEHGIMVRYRIDGILQEAAVINKDEWKKIISRMKILAGAKINIDNKPQDGRYTIFAEGEKIDVRTSFLPTAYGESVVMRLLNSSSIALRFEDLGLRREAYEILEKEIKKPNGLILTTGPTGSGKTTTLYSILGKLNEPGTKIITLEDPIEYQLKGIIQSQINDRQGYSFANGLKSILRQDPDIIMIGEIRDLDTAEIAVQSSLTGHLVLSTLHTNDAAGVIPRLIDMGVKPYFLIPSINAVIGQRLIRKLCPKCKIEHELLLEEEEQVRKILAVISPKSKINVPTKLNKIYRAGQGCDYCSGLGYKSRLGIYEIFTMSDDIKELTVNDAPAFKIMKQAIENGMVTMLQDGVLKALEGTTSLEEVYRVIGNFDYIDDLYEIAMSETANRGIKLKDEQYAQVQVLNNDISKAGEIISNLSTQDMLAVIAGLAIETNASDLHIEPIEDGVKLRYRIDGVLHDISELPKQAYPSLLSEVKIISGFATNIKVPTLDGRFVVFMNNKRYDCRVSIISSGFGETIVVRLLSSDASKLEVEKLGLASYTRKKIEEAIKKTKGIIITTGPTGSGKTTTLYSLLNKLNRPDVKIITVEDPIEYQMDGVMQTQINKNQGYTFSVAMRSLLRQNPNILMIGEIRDEETAAIAIEAAMTGHLVLSTIHANSAASAISRFVGLGMSRDMIANAIEYSIGQRLARRVCLYCKQEYIPEPEVLEEIKKILEPLKNNPEVKIPEKLSFFHGTGCEHCSNLGYKGRIGLYEVIAMIPQIQTMIKNNPSATDLEIEKVAIENGTINIMQDGILKALEGLTSLEEVFRVAK